VGHHFAMPERLRRGSAAILPVPVRMAVDALLRVSDQAGRIIRHEALHAVDSGGARLSTSTGAPWFTIENLPTSSSEDLRALCNLIRDRIPSLRTHSTGESI
jgi:hypothetical protein